VAKRLPPIDVGARFGDWEVIEQLDHGVQMASGQKSMLMSKVRCVCGTEKILANGYLRAGSSNGCGCIRGRNLASQGITHGKSYTPNYRLWVSIKQRLKKDPSYVNVKMYDPWIGDFEQFNAFIDSLGPKPTPDHTLDRKDPYGNYEPGNLRWADKTTQSVNRRNSMVANLLDKSIVDVGKKYDMLTVLELVIEQRHGRNWYAAKVKCDCGTIKTIYQKQLLSEKTKSCGCFKNKNLELGHAALEKPITANGETMSRAAWSRRSGISEAVIASRINKLGWDPARAVTEPVKERLVEANGESMTAADWFRKTGVPASAILRRIDKLGWDPALAVSTPVRHCRSHGARNATSEVEDHLDTEPVADPELTNESVTEPDSASATVVHQVFDDSFDSLFPS
jgi:hypothetical protein